jgi:hypothetical protein
MTNHTNCSHEPTKSARAKCRRDAAKPTPLPTVCTCTNTMLDSDTDRCLSCGLLPEGFDFFSG